MIESKIPGDFRWLWLPYYFHPMTDAINERHAQELVAAKERAKVDPVWWINGGHESPYPRARKHTYLPLNRRYKPLGMLDAYCDYLDYSHQFIRFTSDPCKMEGIWSGSRIAKGDPISPDYLYLYYDDPETHRTLGERYARLMNFITTDWRHGMGCKATEQSEWQELKRTLTASLAKCKTRLPPQERTND